MEKNSDETEYIKHDMVPYINSSLRNSINIRKNLWRIFLKDKFHYNWAWYTKQKTKIFLISNNIQVENKDIILFYDNIIVNKHFANVTKDIDKCNKERNGQFNRFAQHSLNA